MQPINLQETQSDGYVVEGDNVRVLSAFSPYLDGSVKCVYMDPPYRNGDGFAYYDDTLDHETWMKTMSSVLSHIWPLVSRDGSVWISIDDTEMAYLKVLCDTMFGREYYQGTIVWQHRTTRENRATFSHNHEYILVYAKDSGLFKKARNKIAAPDLVKRYKNPDNDPRGPWQSITATAQAGHACESQFYEVVCPTSNVKSLPPKGRCWVYPEYKMKEEIAQGRIWFGADGRGVPRIKKYLKDSTPEVVPNTLWTADEVGTTGQAKKQLLTLFSAEDVEVFDTPKPESLLQRIIEIATVRGDLVLDPYLGSGTSAAAAHKMRRRYIGIDRSARSIQLATARLNKVIEGDTTGISSSVSWKGGGGFKIARFEP